MAVGPESDRKSWALAHHDGDTFTFAPVGENAVSTAEVMFLRSPAARVSGAVIDYYDRTGQGAFVRGMAE